MMDDGSLGRHGLGSSLDGVPFKIGPKFRPPPKVIYQPVFETSCSSRVPKDEYTFETEQAVLTWAKARDEALKKASIEQAEKAAKAAAAQVEAKSKENQADQDGKEDNVNSGNNASTSNQDAAAQQDQTRRPRVPSKPPTQKTSEPGAILKPTPIQHLTKAGNQNGTDAVANSTASNSVFDVSMFEQVDDPFEALELQTLDDMEELKVVLDSSTADNKKESSENPKPDAIPPNSTQGGEATEGFYELATPIPTAWEKFDSQDLFSNVQEQKNSNRENLAAQESARSSESPASDIGEYVDIKEENCVYFRGVNGIKQVSPVNVVKPDQNTSCNNASPGNIPKLESAHGIYKPVLPPIPHNMKVPNGEDKSHSLEQQDNSMSFHNSISATANKTSVSSSDEIFGPTSSKVNFPKPVRLPPPPPTKPNRPAPTPRRRSSGQMVSSAGPSLASSLESSNTSADEHILNPYSRHSMNTSNPDVSQEIQLKLNRYRPLPPAPSPSPNTENRNQPLGLTDPYNSLSREAQAFTDRITSMGFLRARVARAVEKFGQDEKEVLDHLFAAVLLIEKKYAPVHVEAALQSCKNDSHKAERLLEMQTQLEQLGFSSERVRDALITSDMDHDKALDLLTA